MDAMNTQTPDMNHTPTSKVHTWMLILLTWIAVFSIVIVGILLTKGSGNTLSASDLAAACQNGTINGITTNLTRISEACLTANTVDDPAPVVQTGTVWDGKDGDGYLPSLVLPQGWTGSVFMNNAHAADLPYYGSFYATKGISFDCNECGGVGAPAEFNITSTIVDAGTTAMMDTNLIKAAYAKEGDMWSKIMVSTSNLPNGVLVSIDGSLDNPGGVVAHGGTFHILRFKTATTFVEVTFYEDQGASSAEWSFVKKSLDFSLIK